MKLKKFLKYYRAEKYRIQNSPICHLAYTPFTGLGLGAGKHSRGYKGDEWFKGRIEIFKNYTLKSLLNQTEKFFVHWISFRPEEQTNPLTKGLFSYLCGIKWGTIFTFGGLCWRDDKFFIQWIYKLFKKKINNDKILQRLKDTMPSLVEIVDGAKYVYETVVPSDDMYHRLAFDKIQKVRYRHRGAVVFWRGYVYNHNTGQLAEWNPPKGHLPPFYTIMYPADVFLNPKKHLKYMKNFESHEDIEKLFNCVDIYDRMFCVSVHGQNISTSWTEAFGNQHRFIGKEFTDEEEKKKILSEFGINYETQTKDVKLDKTVQKKG